MMKTGFSEGIEKRKPREGHGQPDSRRRDILRAIELLTLRERGVLKRIVGGFSNKEIAAELGVSANTISVHVRNIYKKIHVHSRKEVVSAMAFATRETEKTGAERVRLNGFPRRGGGALRQYVLALDQGTTRSCALVFDKKGHPVSFAQKKLSRPIPVLTGWRMTVWRSGPLRRAWPQRPSLPQDFTKARLPLSALRTSARPR